jgi:hypothetical protein
MNTPPASRTRFAAPAMYPFGMSGRPSFASSGQTSMPARATPCAAKLSIAASTSAR